MIDCDFCDEFAQPTRETRIIARTLDWVVLPTIGCLTEGYLLYMPHEHTLAFADFDEDSLASCSADIEELRSALHERYGPVIVAEHGPRGCDLGAGCCDHAHMHLIPVPDPVRVMAEYTRVGGARPNHDSLAGCLGAVDEAYVYVSPAAGMHYVWPARGFPRQWVRRVCAAIHGRGCEWDWRDYPLEDEFRRTYNALAGQVTLASARNQNLTV